MADEDDTLPRPSRRMWLAGLAGGAVAVPFVWWLDVPRRTRRPVAAAPGGTAVIYVDQDGWMLTPDDVDALAARPTAQ